MVVTRRQSAAAAASVSTTTPSADMLSTATPSRARPSRPSAAPLHHSPNQPSTASDSRSAPPAAVPPPAKKKGDFWARLFSGLALTALFFTVVRAGHLCVAFAVIMMQIGMFSEVLRLGYTAAAEDHIPLWRTTGWFLFVAVQFLLYGKGTLSHFENRSAFFTKNPPYQYALKHHSFLSVCIYCAGFVGFVLSLRQNMYRDQFSYLGRSLVAVLIVVIQSHFMILNIALGLIWFILPCWLIIVNDSFGYFCGRLFGRHSLTALSPKKTWEGYIGAGIFTMIAAYFLSGYLSSFESLVCPKYDYDDCDLLCPLATCDSLSPVFQLKSASISLIPQFLRPITIDYRPVQLHAVALGFFASSIAPFGGFFASGAKRAFGIKDFGRILPGHGGVTDRVDCQLMMAVFTHVYVNNFLKVNFVGSPDVGKVMNFVSELTTNEQVELLKEVYSRLSRKGVENLIESLANLTVSSGR